MQLGLVTYMWGADWDLPTLIKNCQLTGFRGVELRTAHKHGVEPRYRPTSTARSTSGSSIAVSSWWALARLATFIRPTPPS